MASTYAIYERLNIAGAKEAGFPPISPELERLLGTVGDDVVAKVLRFLDPFLHDCTETISGRAIHRVLGYGNYNEFVRAMFKGQKGSSAFVPAGCYSVVEMESTGGRPGMDHLLTADGFLVAALASPTLIGNTVRVWVLGVKNAFSRLAANSKDEAVSALRATLAAAEANAAAAASERDQAMGDKTAAELAKEAAEAAQAEALATLAAALARVKLEPLTLPNRMPLTTGGTYTDNHKFKRLTRAFAYLCVDTLYGDGVRCASTYTGMIMATTGVCFVFQSGEISNIIATTGLQKAMKERIRVWTGEEPKYSTDMTTQQLYTFVYNYTRWYVEYCKAPVLRQSTINNADTGAAEHEVHVELASWLEAIKDKFPDIEPLELGRTVSLNEPLVERGEQLKGQTQLDVYVQRGRLGRKRKVARLQKPEGPVDVVVIADSDSE